MTRKSNKETLTKEERKEILQLVMDNMSFDYLFQTYDVRCVSKIDTKYVWYLKFYMN